LIIWGDYFQSETRIILGCLELCGVKYKFNEINTFLGEHKSDSYLDINPTGQVPTIQDGQNLVIGGYSTFLNYLANSQPKVAKQLYPSNTASEIDSHILWYQCILKPASQRFIRHIVGPKAFGEGQYS